MSRCRVNIIDIGRQTECSKLSLLKKGKALYALHWPREGGAAATGTRSSLVFAGDWFKSFYLMAQQLFLGLLGRPRLAHEEVTIMNAQIAGLVQLKRARTYWLSGPLYLAKYHSTNTFMGQRHII